MIIDFQTPKFFIITFGYGCMEGKVVVAMRIVDIEANSLESIALVAF
jgi:hypothetical protein